MRLRSILTAFAAGLLIAAASPSLAATTTYTGVWAGGTIAPGNTVLLNNGASVIGNVVANGTLQFNQTGSLTLSSTLSGTGSLALTSTGVFNLAGMTAPNTVVLDLTTNVSSGDLQASSGGAELRVGNASIGVLNVNGGRVSDAVGWLGYNSGVSGSATVSSGTWSNTYDLRVGGSGIGVLNVNGGKVTNTFGWIGTNPGSSGTATLSSGTWENGNDLNVGFNGSGVLNIAGGFVANTYGWLGRNASGSGTATITGGTWANGGNLTVGGSGTGTLTMTGGLVTVGGTLAKGAYGTINLQPGGTLQIGTGGTTGVLATDLTNNGTLVFNRSDASSYSGVLSGTGSLVKMGAGLLALTGSSAFAGEVRIENGTIRPTANGAIGSGPIVISDLAAGISLGDGATLMNDIQIDRPAGAVSRATILYEGSNWARVSSGTITILRKSMRGGDFGTIGSGTLFIDSPIVTSNETGTSWLSIVVARRGTTVFSGGGNYSNFHIGEGKVRLGGDDGLSRNAIVRVGAVDYPSTATLDLAGFSQSLQGVVRGLPAGIIGNSSTVLSSTLTLTGSSTYSGVIQDSIDGGTKQVCLEIDGGWLGLTNANTMSGSTTVRNGSIQLGHAMALPYSEVSILAGGTLSLAPGLKTTVGGLKRVGSGVVDVGNGLITVADGLSAFNLYAGLSLGRGSGAWDGVSGIKSSAAAASGGSRTVGWLDNGDGSMTFGYAASGDTNLDWSVDILDIANFIGSGRFNSGLTATWAEGDFNYDGFADVLDMADFVSSGLFNAAPYNGTAQSIAAVPEPSTLGLAGVGVGVAWLLAKRRKQAA